MHAAITGYWTETQRSKGRGIVELILPGFDAGIRQVYSVALGIAPEDLPQELVQTETKKLRLILSGDFGPDYVRLQEGIVQNILGMGTDYQTYMVGYSFYQATLVDLVIDAQAKLPMPLKEATRIVQVAAMCDATITLGYFFEDLDRRAQEQRKQLLDRLFSQIGEDTQALEFSSSELRGTFDSLSHRAETQAAALEQNSAALTQLETQIAATANDAKGAALQTAEANTRARDARHEVAQTRESVRDVVTKTEEIRRFIDMVDQIALQTKLLALNASVEAARAGEHGRGFSIVATEVRALADQSAKSAAEVAAVVKTILAGMTAIDVRSDALTARLTDLVQGIGEASDSVARIDAAAQEQSDAIVQVATNQRHLDQANQANAAGVGAANTQVRAFEETVGQINQRIADFRSETVSSDQLRSA
ncbi:hypothetical protein J4E08_07575 [Sagittula sp. NFXS13]|uniref:methyl-accepting chemotaxis protein n=1 Tax=Sagittula sp. NFXS13 TaxID=2819095 RepID=UPI0032DFADDD